MKWISLEDSHPEDGERVLIKDKDGIIHSGIAERMAINNSNSSLYFGIAEAVNIEKSTRSLYWTKIHLDKRINFNYAKATHWKKEADAVD